MAQIVDVVTSSIARLLSTIGTGISSAFSRLVYVTEVTAGPDEILGTIDDVVVVTEELSPFAQWGLVFLGIGIALTIFYSLFRLIRR